MKKTLPFLSLVVALGACEKQPEYIFGQDVLCGERKVLDCKNENMFCDHYVNIFVCEDMFNNKTITGRVVKLYPDGIKKAEFFVKNGFVTGTAEIFYQDGKLRESVQYKHGKLHGMRKDFYPNGNLNEVTRFINGTAIETKTYREDGTLSFKQRYKDDFRQGFDKQGRLKTESKTHMVKQVNNIVIDKAYDENGTIKKIIYQQPFQIDNGDYATYAVGIEQYKNGKLDGVRTKYYLGGTFTPYDTEYTEEWKDGQLNGKTVYYNKVKRTVEAEVNYENGMRNGASRTFNLDGSVETESTFLKDNLHGKVKIFYKNGQPKQEISYEYGVRDGVTVTYSEEGNIISTKLYKDGKLIEAKE